MRVRFAENSELKLVRGLGKYKDDLWLTKKDYQDFSHQAALAISRMNSSGVASGQYALLHQEGTSAILGLESFLTPSTAREVKLRRRVLIDAILLEQRRQRIMGFTDPVELARISQSFSEYSAHRARSIGLLHTQTRPL